jgi:hypothetical protein
MFTAESRLVLIPGAFLPHFISLSVLSSQTDGLHGHLYDLLAVFPPATYPLYGFWTAKLQSCGCWSSDGTPALLHSAQFNLQSTPSPFRARYPTDIFT